MKNNLAKSSGSDIGDLENLEEGHVKILADNEATLIATLANLGRLSVQGSADAEKMIADLGLKCTSLLSEVLESPQSPSYKESAVKS